MARLYRVKEKESFTRILARHEQDTVTQASAKPGFFVRQFTQSEIDELFAKRVTALAWTQDGSHVLSAGRSDNTIRLTSMKGESSVEELAHPGGMTAAYILSDGSRLVTAGTDGTIALWDAAGKLIQRFLGPAQPIRVLALTANGTKVAGADGSGLVWVWDLASGQRHALESPGEHVRRLASPARWAVSGLG